MQHAGNHQPTPGGLLLPVSATLKGRVRWQVLDERGLPEVPRSPSGFALAPAEGVEQPNLITDLGLDQIAAFDCFGTSPDSSATWRRYLAVGTGSTVPANGDTTLAAEVQRANSSGSFSSGTTTYELDTDDNVWRATSLVTRIVTMTEDRNLAEFGLSPASSAAVGIRELLRDSEGDPITVSLLNGKTLRVDHTLTIELPAPVAGTPATINVNQYDAGNNLVGSTPYDVVHGGYVRNSANEERLARLFGVWNPAPNHSYSSPQNCFHDSSPAAYSRTTSNSGSAASTPVQETYVSGSRQRIKRATFAAGTAVGPIYGFRFRINTEAQNAWDAGWRVVFSSPASYVKANTDTLRVGIVSTWARAA